MSSRINQCALTILITVLSYGGDRDVTAAPRQETGAEVWPKEIAGRHLQAVTDHFVLYAADEESAQTMSRWLSKRLAAFGMKYGCQPTDQGLVFLLDQRDELPPAVAEWRRKHVSRAREIYWVSSTRRMSHRTSAGRPYSFFSYMYFVESFAIPYEACLEAGVLEALPQDPAWVCFLATDRYVTDEFSRNLDKHRQENLCRRQKISEDQVVGWTLYTLLGEALYPVYLGIDVQLACLQRQEVLFEALLGACPIEEERRARLVEHLRDDVDEQWGDIWFRRPID